MKAMVALFLCLVLALGAAAQTGKSTTTAKPAKATTPQSAPAPAPAVDQAELDALKADLQRMTVILNQLRSNLGFVTNTTGPLKHQFELEIDMWQMQLGQMERRIQRLEEASRRQ